MAYVIDAGAIIDTSPKLVGEAWTLSGWPSVSASDEAVAVMVTTAPQSSGFVPNLNITVPDTDWETTTSTGRVLAVSHHGTVPATLTATVSTWPAAGCYARWWHVGGVDTSTHADGISRTDSDGASAGSPVTIGFTASGEDRLILAGAGPNSNNPASFSDVLSTYTVFQSPYAMAWGDLVTDSAIAIAWEPHSTFALAALEYDGDLQPAPAAGIHVGLAVHM
jgi:hypothetical protein